MTMNRDKLLELAKEAGFATFSDGMISVDNGYGTYIGCNGKLERFAALLSQQEQEPVAFQFGEGYKYVANHWHPQNAGDVTIRPLYLAPPPAQGWNEAIEAAADEMHRRRFEQANTAEAKIVYENAYRAIRALARPSQAQEPTEMCPHCDDPLPAGKEQCDACDDFDSTASASGAVDDREEVEPSAEIIASLDKVLSQQPAQVTNDLPPLPDARCLGDDVGGSQIFGYTADQMREYARLSRAQHAAPEWKCAARTSAPEPADCNWPVCGCDPRANIVIEALEEGGALATPSAAMHNHTGHFSDTCPACIANGGAVFAAAPSTQPQGGWK